MTQHPVSCWCLCRAEAWAPSGFLGPHSSSEERSTLDAEVQPTQPGTPLQTAREGRSLTLRMTDVAGDGGQARFWSPNTGHWSS